MAPRDAEDLQEDFDDFFDNALCGYITATADGQILRANVRLAEWLAVTPAALVGKRVSDLLTIGGRIYFETHLFPLLRMQGHFGEVAVELSVPDGTKIHVLVNAIEHKSLAGEVLFTRYAIFKATERRIYEQNIVSARLTAEEALRRERETSQLREQFIAVLGHDLRNPLSGVSGALNLLSALKLEPRAQAAVRLAESSVTRMRDLINDIMDFARGRLGSGIALDMQAVELDAALEHVVEELKVAHPARDMAAHIAIPCLIRCDRARLCQVLSNLLANAVTHGSPEGPIRVFGQVTDGELHVSVTNTGKPIPPDALQYLFEPFTREDHRPSQNGLGLGLYIASEIIKAHSGRLWATSDAAETRFTFTLPVAKSDAQAGLPNSGHA